MLQHLRYLDDQCLGCDAGKDRFLFLPDLCIASLKNGLFTCQDAVALQHVFNTFVNSKDCLYAFIIGSVSHWVTLCANKVNGTLEW